MSLNGANWPVLVLNQNFEPLNVCDTRRAVILVYVGKAHIMADGRGEIHGPESSLPRPSVIRLGHMIQRPRPRVRLNRRELFRRDHFACQYCGAQTPHLTLDHVVPRHRGGSHTWDNLVSACRVCNRRKGGRTPWEAGMHLHRPPREPQGTYAYVFQPYLERNEDWLPFLQGWF